MLHNQREMTETGFSHAETLCSLLMCPSSFAPQSSLSIPIPLKYPSHQQSAFPFKVQSLTGAKCFLCNTESASTSIFASLSTSKITHWSPETGPILSTHLGFFKHRDCNLTACMVEMVVIVMAGLSSFGWDVIAILRFTISLAGSGSNSPLLTPGICKMLLSYILLRQVRKGKPQENLSLARKALFLMSLSWNLLYHSQLRLPGNP